MPMQFDKLPPGIEEPLVDIEELAEYLGITKRGLENWIRDGRFPAPLRVGRRYRRWTAEQINQWIAGGCPAESHKETEQ